MKKIYIINCFETYNERVQNVRSFFESKNYVVEEVVSNFEHMSKTFVVNNETEKVYIDVPSYKKNLSIRRLFSHYIFSKRVIKYLNTKNVSMIYVLIPPNYLTKRIIENYELSSTKIIFDVIDLWPEAMNIEKFNFIYSKWKKVRNQYIYKADRIITECNLFKEVLQQDNELDISINTVYFTGSDNYYLDPKKSADNCLNICYLGSINNIINIDKIIEVLNKMKKIMNVKLHIIGDGERKDIFIRELKNNKIDNIFYGKIYDESRKKDILLNCDFGLNIMKEDIKVGLTMKSIEYFRHSLPIINNIKHDTELIVKQNKVGINDSDNQFDELLNSLSEDKEQLKIYKENTNLNNS